MDNTNLTQFVDLDFLSNQQDQLALIQARWPGNWNDFLSSNFGMFLVDLMAWNVSTMAFLVNRQAGELFVGTMSLRESAIRLGALGNYSLRGPTPATVMCEASISSALDNDVTIAKGTLVQTTDSIPFEANADYVISAGSTTPSSTVIIFSTTQVGQNVLATLVKFTPGSIYADVVNSSLDMAQYVSVGQVVVPANPSGTGEMSYTIVAISASEGAVSNNRLVLNTAYTGTSVDYLSATVVERRITLVQGQTITDSFTTPASNTANFYATLSRIPVIDNSVSVQVNNVTWTQATSPLDLTPTSMSYRVKTTPTGVTVVTFGDDQLGQSVPANSTISITYRVGGGSLGNIAAGDISTSIVGFLAGSQNPITITIANTTNSGQGGQDEETLEEARTHIPLAFKANDRAVTIDDCQEVALSFANPLFGSVAFARAFPRATNSLLEGNIIDLYAWTTGPGGSLVSLSPAIKLGLQGWMASRSVGTDYIVINDGTSTPAPIAFMFNVASGFDIASTTQLLWDLLTSTINALRPGDPITYSSLVTKLNTTMGVASVIMATPINDLTTTSTTELFTVPQDSHVYDVVMTYQADVDNSTDGVKVTNYTAQLPVAPVAPWALTMALGSEILAIVPGISPGKAWVINTNVLSADPNYVSTIDLLTGAVSLWTKGVVSNLTMQLITMQGYNSDRAVNIYVSYVGLDTAEKRQEIRTRVKTWGGGLGIGATLYGQEVQGIVISKSNVQAVIEATPDVDQVTKITVGTPINTGPTMTAGATELLKIGQVILNGNAN